MSRPSKEGGVSLMTHSQKTMLPTVPRANPQPIDADVAKRERRYERAIAGWFASRMRARAQERRRGRPKRTTRDE